MNRDTIITTGDARPVRTQKPHIIKIVIIAIVTLNIKYLPDVLLQKKSYHTIILSDGENFEGNSLLKVAEKTLTLRFN